MKAVGDFILVEQIKERQTALDGMLTLSVEDTDIIRYRKGMVISSGSLCEGISVGDIIHYDKNGHTMLIEGRKVTVIRLRDVVAKED